MDGGLSRKKAVSLVGGGCFILGLPSALSLAFFNNQDHVWGLGLMVSGAFFIFLVLKIGPKKFREEILTKAEHKVRLGRGFDFLVKFFLPVQLVAMLVWWFWASYQGDPENWLDVFSVSSVGTVLFQWGVALIVFFAFNKVISGKIIQEEPNHDD
jgi:NSS family neurotransmitter:Na+ symporter